MNGFSDDAGSQVGRPCNEIHQGEKSEAQGGAISAEPFPRFGIMRDRLFRTLEEVDTLRVNKADAFADCPVLGSAAFSGAIVGEGAAVFASEKPAVSGVEKAVYRFELQGGFGEERGGFVGAFGTNFYGAFE